MCLDYRAKRRYLKNPVIGFKSFSVDTAEGDGRLYTMNTRTYGGAPRDYRSRGNSGICTPLKQGLKDGQFYNGYHAYKRNQWNTSLVYIGARVVCAVYLDGQIQSDGLQVRATHCYVIGIVYSGAALSEVQLQAVFDRYPNLMDFRE